MDRKVTWSYEAASDLEAIAEYIARDSSFYAAAFVQEVLAAGRALDKFSERGRVVPEIGNPGIRELFVRQYRLVYRIEEPRVVVLGLVHGKRDIKSLWEKEDREV